MPGAEAMTAFTPEADARLAAYLHQVRAALAAAPDVDPAEVEADIREHVDAEFAGSAGPVGLTELEGVLARLGPPAAWAGGVGDARPVREQFAAGARAVRDGLRQTARGVAEVLWRGPEDWRLAYLTFAAFALFLLALPALDDGPAPLVFLFVAYVLGRAAIALAAEKRVPLGARRWLAYPPLVLVSLPLLVGTLAFPLAAGVTAFRVTADGTETSKRWPARGRGDVPFFQELFPGLPNVKPVRVGAMAGVGAAALGYAVLGGLVWGFPGLTRAVFVPFLAGVGGKHGRRLFLGAFAVLVAWVAAVYPLVGRVMAVPVSLTEPAFDVAPDPPRRVATPSTTRVNPPRPPALTLILPPANPNAARELLPPPKPARR